MSWDDMATPFLSTRLGAAAGESVVFRPYGKPPRTILAVGEDDESGERRVWTVANNGLTGISTRTLDRDKDTLEVAFRIGEDASERSIVRIVAHDAATVTLEVR